MITFDGPTLTGIAALVTSVTGLITVLRAPSRQSTSSVPPAPPCPGERSAGK